MTAALAAVSWLRSGRAASGQNASCQCTENSERNSQAISHMSDPIGMHASRASLSGAIACGRWQTVEIVWRYGADSR